MIRTLEVSFLVRPHTLHTPRVQRRAQRTMVKWNVKQSRLESQRQIDNLRNHVLLQDLRRFYAEEKNWNKLIEITERATTAATGNKSPSSPPNNDSTTRKKFSLRMYDHFCKKYLKNHPFMLRNGQTLRGVYKSKLDINHKKNFDPFNRSQSHPFYFEVQGRGVMYTNIAQLMYCRYLIEHKVPDIVEKHENAIRMSMKRNKAAKA